MKPTRELISLISAGAHLDLRHAGKPTTDLIHIAEAAAAKGVTVIINGSKPTTDLVRIAAAGRGHVTIAWNAE